MKNRLQPPATEWMDDRLVVRESPVEGRGLFFTDRLPAGTVVIRLGGRLVSSAELGALMRDADADPAAPYVDTITVYDGATWCSHRAQRSTSATTAVTRPCGMSRHSRSRRAET